MSRVKYRWERLPDPEVVQKIKDACEPVRVLSCGASELVVDGDLSAEQIEAVRQLYLGALVYQRPH